MKILFLAPYVPSRIRVRPFQFILELAKRHQVHVIALAEGGGASLAGVDELKEAVESFEIITHGRLRGPAQALLSLPTRTPMCAAYCWSPTMSRAVSEAVASNCFDVVHIEHLRAAHFADSCSKIPVVFDAVDCLAGLFRQMSSSSRSPLSRLVMREEASKLRRYEPRTLRGFDRVIITSESERDELLSLDPSLEIDVVPNGVDANYFAPQEIEKRPRRIVFSGKMSYEPNAQAAVWFARNVLPALRESFPDTEFLIVGSKPPKEVMALSSEPGIYITGYVEDIRPHVASACVAVVPMQVAVGMQNKLLEAMAMGLPVVATPIAARPLGLACAGVRVAAGPQEMIDEVTALLRDPVLAQRVGLEAREEVLRNYSWRSSVERLEAIYGEAASAQA